MGGSDDSMGGCPQYSVFLSNFIYFISLAETGSPKQKGNDMTEITLIKHDN